MLKYVTAKRWWGVEPCQIVAIKDKVYIVVTGTRITVYDENDEMGTFLFPEYERPLQSIPGIAISDDKKYLAVSIILKTVGADASNSIASNVATMLIYDSSTYLNPTMKPRVLEYEDTHSLISTYKCLSFSEDSTLLLCKVHGCILVYEWMTGDVKFQVGEASEDVRHLSFYRGDTTKLVGIGKNNFFRVWRYTRNKIHAVPVGGSQAVPCSYNSLVWMNKEVLVSGCSNGQVCVFSMSSCDLRCRLQAFDTTESIATVLSRADIILALTASGLIGVIEVTLPDPAIKVSLLGIYALQPAKSYLGISWCYQTSMLSFDVVCSSTSAIAAYDLKIAYLRQDVIDRVVAEIDNSPPTSPGNPLNRRGSFNLAMQAAAAKSSMPIKQQLKPRLTLSTHHYGAIALLSTASRISALVSFSKTDQVIRVWNYFAPKGPCFIEHKIEEHPKNDAPHNLALHPNGRVVAFACENDTQEYAIADGGLTFIKRIPTRVAVTAPNGEPYANYAPSSFVRYSHGGHMLAVVTGKSIQVFDLHNLEYSSDPHGSPTRCAVFTNHVGLVLGLEFSMDDRRIYSYSDDGCLYEWEIGALRQQNEYFLRRCQCSILSISSESLIAAYFEDVSKRAVPSRRMSRRGLMANTKLQATSERPHRQLCLWKYNVSLTPDCVIDVVGPAITSLCMCNVKLTTSEFDRDHLCIIGYEDGTVVLSALPIPLRTIEVASFMMSSLHLAVDTERTSSPMSTAGDGMGVAPPTNSQVIDLEKCKRLHYHKGAVVSLSASECGNWLFTGGSDGALFMFATNYKAVNTVFHKETGPLENSLIVTDTHQLKSLQQDARRRRNEIEELVSESRKQLEQLRSQKDDLIASLEGQLTREVSKRDKIIITERELHIKAVASLHREIDELKSSGEKEVAVVEHDYEVKLAQESLYLYQMRQAYEELGTNRKLDFEAAMQAAAKREQRLNDEIQALKQENERQKELVAQYAEFIREKSDEVITGIEELHEERVAELQQVVEVQTEAAQEAEAKGKADIALLRREIKALKEEIFTRQRKNESLDSELAWAKEKNNRLEEALLAATIEIKERAEANARLEFKAGDQQQALADLERARKTLTAQLFDLRMDTGPKEEMLASTIARLREVEREYEHSLHAMAEKDLQLSQKSAAVQTLQQQNRDLRSGVAKKDQSLKRAAAQLVEFKFALQHASINAMKKAVPVAAEFQKAGSKSATRIEEFIIVNDEMNVSLKRLEEILTPFVDAEAVVDLANEFAEQEEAFSERERHMQLLTRNVVSLKDSLTVKDKVATKQILGNIADNTDLITEVNSLRKEIRYLALENQKLLARQSFMEGQRKQDLNKTTPVKSASKVTGKASKLLTSTSFDRIVVEEPYDDTTSSPPEPVGESFLSRSQNEMQLPKSLEADAQRRSLSSADRKIEEIIRQNAEAIITAKLQEASLRSSSTESSAAYFTAQKKINLIEKPRPKKYRLQPVTSKATSNPERYASNSRNSKPLDLLPTVEQLVQQPPSPVGSGQKKKKKKSCELV